MMFTVSACVGSGTSHISSLVFADSGRFSGLLFLLHKAPLLGAGLALGVALDAELPPACSMPTIYVFYFLFFIYVFLYEYGSPAMFTNRIEYIQIQKIDGPDSKLLQFSRFPIVVSLRF